MNRLAAATALFVTLLAGRAYAQSSDGASGNGQAVLLPGIAFRNGDWVAVTVTGLDLVTAPGSPTCIATTGRAEVGVGGAAVAIGLATNLFDASCEMNQRFIESGILSLEARVERSYGPTTWRKTAYAGAQISLRSLWWWSPSVGWMFDMRQPTYRHLQVGLSASF